MVNVRNMKKFLVALVAIMALAACAEKTNVLTVETPVRPVGQEDAILMTAEPIDTVRIGVVGLGMRGRGALKRLSRIPGAEVIALCDLDSANVAKGQGRLERYGAPRAEEYWGSEDAWMEMCRREDLDLIYVVTDWENHAKMGVYAMEQGKHVAIEVPAAMNLDEIWQLINTSERTRKHCMQLENCVYDRFELTTLSMAQQGLFGEILHVEGAYIHSLDEFWGEYWNNWRLKYNRGHRGDVYPTHGMGPACQLLDIHRGDRMKTLVAMDTKAVTGGKIMERMTGEKCEDFKQGDHTLTMISTEKGKTMLIEHNVMNPRPYSRMYQLTGTEGFANKYPVEQYLFKTETLADGEVPDHENLNSHTPVPDEVKEALMLKYKHRIHQDLEEQAAKVGGHGGMDYLMDYRLIYCLRNGLPLDMDVYDLAEWCCLSELTRLSLENGNCPVEVPDFTRGAWNKVQGYRHAFVN